jgi:exopolyphosphatase/guanosine-5'-triphosphate,3'-diphosphate pyrophosphatase
MKRPRAAIDIGTHTARLLIASDPVGSGQLGSIARKRTYIRLSEGFDYLKESRIQPGAIDRTVTALKVFSQDINGFNVRSTHAIATGLVRKATNRDEFLGRIFERTGIRVKLISGEEEALLTAKGVLHALGVQAHPFFIFDLGGGSTEFFVDQKGEQIATSIPLGAATLTKDHLKSDPPNKTQVDSLSGYIDHCLNKTGFELIRRGEQSSIVGTGGTVTTLALMLHGISSEDVSAERLNGLVLKRQQIEALFDRMKGLKFEDRLTLPGLDRGRAGIILAGCLVVMKILHFLNAIQLTVSLSDLLEGILIKHFKGERNG